MYYRTAAGHSRNCSFSGSGFCRTIKNKLLHTLQSLFYFEKQLAKMAKAFFQKNYILKFLAL